MGILKSYKWIPISESCQSEIGVHFLRKFINKVTVGRQGPTLTKLCCWDKLSRNLKTAGLELSDHAVNQVGCAVEPPSKFQHDLTTMKILHCQFSVVTYHISAMYQLYSNMSRWKHVRFNLKCDEDHVPDLSMCPRMIKTFNKSCVSLLTLEILHHVSITL